MNLEHFNIRHPRWGYPADGEKMDWDRRIDLWNRQTEPGRFWKKGKKRRGNRNKGEVRLVRKQVSRRRKIRVRK